MRCTCCTESADGLRSTDPDFWHQDKTGIANSVEDGDQFGASLAAGDFDGDGYGDLAIGVPGEDLPNPIRQARDTGMVHVLHGSPTGLTATGANVVRAIDHGLASNAQFGFAMAPGSVLGDGTPMFDFDGLADLVVGAAGASEVRIFNGQHFTSGDDPLVVQSTAWTAGEGYGSVIAVGEVTGNPGEEIVYGLPTYDEGGLTDSGAILFTTSSLGSVSTQSTGGVSGAVEDFDRFGSAATMADLDGDGWAEIVVGVPREDVSGRIDAGVIHVFWTAPDDFIAPYYTQSIVNGTLAAGEQFGWSLATGRFDSGIPSRMHLAIGSPGEVGGHGAVGWVARTSGTTLAGGAFEQGFGPFGEVSESGDRFGQVLTTSNLGRTGADELDHRRAARGCRQPRERRQRPGRVRGERWPWRRGPGRLVPAGHRDRGFTRGQRAVRPTGPLRPSRVAPDFRAPESPASTAAALPGRPATARTTSSRRARPRPRVAGPRCSRAAVSRRRCRA